MDWEFERFGLKQHSAALLWSDYKFVDSLFHRATDFSKHLDGVGVEAWQPWTNGRAVFDPKGGGILSKVSHWSLDQ